MKNNITVVFNTQLPNYERDQFSKLLKAAAVGIDNVNDLMTPEEHMTLIVLYSKMSLPRTEPEQVLHELCDDYVKTGVFKMPKETPFSINCICKD